MNFILWLPLPCEISSNMYIVIFCKPGCDFVKNGINLIFLIKPFLYMTKKCQDKNLNILRTKRVFKMKEKAFF